MRDFMAFLSNVNAILQPLQAAVIVVGAVIGTPFALYKLTQNAKPRYLDGLYHMRELLSTKEARSEREEVFRLPATVDPNRPTFAEELAKVRSLTTRYDFIGHLVKTGILPERYVVPLYYLQVVRVWNKTKPYMDYYGTEQGIAEHYQARFRFLYERCERYRLKHNRDAASTISQEMVAVGTFNGEIQAES